MPVRCTSLECSTSGALSTASTQAATLGTGGISLQPTSAHVCHWVAQAFDLQAPHHWLQVGLMDVVLKLLASTLVVWLPMIPLFYLMRRALDSKTGSA